MATNLIFLKDRHPRYKPAARDAEVIPCRLAPPQASHIDLTRIGDCLGHDIELLECRIASLDLYRDREELRRARQALFQLNLARQILYGQDP